MGDATQHHLPILTCISAWGTLHPKISLNAEAHNPHMQLACVRYLLPSNLEIPSRLNKSLLAQPGHGRIKSLAHTDLRGKPQDIASLVDTVGHVQAVEL